MSPKWIIQGWITRNTYNRQKLYKLDLSYTDISFSKNIFSNIVSNNGYEFIKTIHRNKNHNLFDSTIEKKFAEKFIHAKTKWNLIREPNPLILPNGNVIIPDFLFIRLNKKVYFEIVGFWTLNYLKRKFQKIKDLLEYNKEHFIIAIDKKSLVSHSEDLKPFYKIFQDRYKKNFIFYENNIISIKNILTYLKSLDNEIIDHDLTENKLKICSFLENLTKTKQEIIFLEDFALQHDITIESIIQMFTLYLKKHQIHEMYTLVDSYLISNEKLKKIFSSIKKVEKFNDVRSILNSYNMPESLHISIINNLGFELEWNGLDNLNIKIRKNNRFHSRNMKYLNYPSIIIFYGLSAHKKNKQYLVTKY